MDIPAWFGQFEYYLAIVTMWMFMISWLGVNLIRVGGVKWDIKSKIVAVKNWWIKRKGDVDPFEKYQGVYGKHAGDGMLYYFIKKPGSNYILDAIYCALELREKMREFSSEWKMHKGWLNDIYLNIGINEGKEFFGTIVSASSIVFTALGDSINYAARLSDLARFGSIWTTKNVINKLSAEELKEIHFGIRHSRHDREVFVKNSYSRVIDLIDPTDKRYGKFLDISTLPVTEIVDGA